MVKKLSEINDDLVGKLVVCTLAGNVAYGTINKHNGCFYICNNHAQHGEIPESERLGYPHTWDADDGSARSLGMMNVSDISIKVGKKKNKIEYDVF